MDLEQLPALERSLTVEEKRHTEARQAGVRLPTHKCLGVCGLDLLCVEKEVKSTALTWPSPYLVPVPFVSATFPVRNN